LNPKDAQIYKAKGITSIHFKHYREALTAFEKAIQLNPNDTSALKSKGAALDRLGRFREAQQIYEYLEKVSHN